MKSKIYLFFKKHYDLSLMIFFLVATILVAQLLFWYLPYLGNRGLFRLSTYYLILLLLIYFLNWRSPKFLEKINAHQVLITILSLLLPVWLFFYQLILNESQQNVKAEIFLSEENNRNDQYLKSIITDLNRDPRTLFWRDFSIDKLQATLGLYLNE